MKHVVKYIRLENACMQIAVANDYATQINKVKSYNNNTNET